MDASEVWIWTDVDGLMTTDPLDIETARSIPQLSYDEAAELAYFGARVLHSRMVGLLQQNQIPVRVRNVYDPQAPGTLIRDTPLAANRASLQAVTMITAIAVTAKRSGSLAALTQVVDEVFQTTTGTSVDVMIAAQSPHATFACFIVPTTSSPNASHDLQFALNDRIRSTPHLHGWETMNVAVITLVGAALRRSHELTAQVLTHLDGMSILAVSYSPSRCGISIVMPIQDADEALRRLHQLIVPESNPQ
jgi:aspartate kinase